MGKRRRRGGKSNGGEGAPANKNQRTDDRRTSYKDLFENRTSLFDAYYKAMDLIPEEEWNSFLAAAATKLPTTFRIHMSSVYGEVTTQYLQNELRPALGGLELDDGVKIKAPEPLAWYPDAKAWQIDIPRGAFRKNALLKNAHSFVVSSSETGITSRQEAVSMIPPLMLDPHAEHHVLDLCAAPGSKTSQLLESMASNAKVRGVPLTGWLIANDVDHRRCHLLHHQVKRTELPNYLVTCHDATLFPNLYRPQPESGEELSAADRLVRYDRVLADVPCSGDATMRKNHDVWKTFSPKNGRSLHKTQLLCARRASQLTKVGGRFVYSTCSMNPVENEAVVSELLRTSDGSLRLLDVSDKLPAFKRRPGVTSWSVPVGMFKNSEEILKLAKNMDEAKAIAAEIGTPAMVSPSMFPGTEEELKAMNIDRCLRVYPHLQDTGGFFIAVFEKLAPATRDETSTSTTTTTTTTTATATTTAEDEAESAAPLKLSEEGAAQAAANQTTTGDGSSSKQAMSKQERQAYNSEKAIEAGGIDVGDAVTDADKAGKGGENDPSVKGVVLEEDFVRLDPESRTWTTFFRAYGPRDDYDWSLTIRGRGSANSRKMYYLNADQATIMDANPRLRVVNGGMRLSTVENTGPPRISQEAASVMWDKITMRKVEIPGADFVTILRHDDGALYEDMTPAGREAVQSISEVGGILMSVLPDPALNIPPGITMSGWKGNKAVKFMLCKAELATYRFLFFDPESRATIPPPGHSIADQIRARELAERAAAAEAAAAELAAGSEAPAVEGGDVAAGEAEKVDEVEPMKE